MVADQHPVCVVGRWRNDPPGVLLAPGSTNTWPGNSDLDRVVEPDSHTTSAVLRGPTPSSITTLYDVRSLGHRADADRRRLGARGLAREYPRIGHTA